jgi:hypothetical protein
MPSLGHARTRFELQPMLYVAAASSALQIQLIDMLHNSESGETMRRRGARRSSGGRGLLRCLGRATRYEHCDVRAIQKYRIEARDALTLGCELTEARGTDARARAEGQRARQAGGSESTRSEYTICHASLAAYRSSSFTAHGALVSRLLFGDVLEHHVDVVVVALQDAGHLLVALRDRTTHEQRQSKRGDIDEQALSLRWKHASSRNDAWGGR